MGAVTILQAALGLGAKGTASSLRPVSSQRRAASLGVAATCLLGLQLPGGALADYGSSGECRDRPATAGDRSSSGRFGEHAS